MKKTKFLEIFLIVIGFTFGCLINFNYIFKVKFFGSKNLKKLFNNEVITEEVTNTEKYDTKLADDLFEQIKIVCLILTQPKDHQTKAQYVKKTWGSKCNKLIFLSTIQDDELGSITFPYNESREILWGKVRGGFKYAYEHHFDDADWFLKADDDS